MNCTTLFVRVFSCKANKTPYEVRFERTFQLKEVSTKGRAEDKKADTVRLTHKTRLPLSDRDILNYTIGKIVHSVYCKLDYYLLNKAYIIASQNLLIFTGFHCARKKMSRVDNPSTALMPS